MKKQQQEQQISQPTTIQNETLHSYFTPKTNKNDNNDEPDWVLIFYSYYSYYSY